MIKKLIGALFVVLVGIGIFSALRINALENRISYLQSLPARIDTMRVIDIDSTLVTRYAQEVSKLTSDNAKLTNDLKQTKRSLKASVELTACYRDSLGMIETVPVVIDSDTVRQFYYTKEDSSLVLAGYSQTKPPYYTNITKIGINAEIGVGLAQNKDDVWSAYGWVIKPDGMKLTNIQAKVVPYKKKFLEKFGFKVGTNIGSITGADFGLTFDTGRSQIGISRGWNDVGDSYWRVDYTPNIAKLLGL